MSEYLKLIVEYAASVTLPFLNPKIADDVAGATAAAVLLAAIICYFLSIPRSKDQSAKFIAITALIVFFFCLFALFALQREVLPLSPAISSMFADIFFVSYFAALAGGLAWGAAQLRGKPE
jgi:hypothetical protein